MILKRITKDSVVNSVLVGHEMTPDYVILQQTKRFFAILRTIGPDPDGPLQTYFGLEKNDKKELKSNSFFISLF